MNATSTPSTDFIIQENANGSDSDTNPDDTPEYYQPISAVDYDYDDDEEQDPDQVINSDEEHHSFQASDSDIHHLPNGYCTHGEAGNGISSLDLNEDVEQGSSEDEEEERMREASDSEILRAFSEDESRRNAPLPAENVMRVMEAMRGVSFVGLPPDWAHTVPEDRWIYRPRRLRQPPPPPPPLVGLPPDWAHTVPEDRWIYRPRRLSQPPPPPPPPPTT